MPKQAHLYVGRAGQMAVMSEYLIRGYNVAIPEVDIGDDIFVVRDDDGSFSRIQVKTAIAHKIKGGYSARYTVKLSQVIAISEPEIWYVFASRLQEQWQSFVVIPRPELEILHSQHKIGSVNQFGLLSLYFSFADSLDSGTKVTCSGQNFSPFLNNWQDWPTIQHDERTKF